MNSFKDQNMFGNMGLFGQNPYTDEYLDQVKEIMNRYQQFLNEDFWKNMNKRENKTDNFPVEMWESDEELFVLAHIPRVHETRQVKVTFSSARKIKIRATLETYQPPATKRQLASEFPGSLLERYVTLPYAVESDNYAINVDHGVTVIIFRKSDPDVQVPFDF